MPSVDVVPIRLVGEVLGTPVNSARDAGIEPSGNSRPRLIASPSRFLGVVIPRYPTQWTPSKTTNARKDRNLNPRTTSAGPATVTKPNAHVNLATTNDDSVDDTPTSMDGELLIGVSNDVASVRRVLFARDGPPVPVTRDGNAPRSVVNSRPAVHSAPDVPVLRPSAENIEDEPHSTEKDVISLVSPEVARDYYMQGVITSSDSGITESDAESFSHDILSTNLDATNETDAEHATEESQPASHNEAAFTGSVVDALASAFAANNNDSGIGTSPPPSPSSPPTARQSLFLESLSDDESGTSEPAVSTSRPVPTREPQAGLRVSRPVRASTVDDTNGGVHDFDEHLDGEDATYAYDKTTHGPTLQAFIPPPASTGPTEPVILRRSHYTSVTEHFLQRVEEWFGPDALTQLDQATLDGPSKNIRKARFSSTKPPTPVPAPSSRVDFSTEVLKRKRVASATEHSTVKESRTIKKPRILEDLNNAPSRASDESRVRQPGEVLLPYTTSPADMDLLRKIVEHMIVPTDEEINKVNLLISRLNVAGEHDVYEGKTTSDAHFRVMVPKSIRWSLTK